MSKIALVVTSGSVQESKLWWVPSGDGAGHVEPANSTDGTYIALPRELVKDVSGSGLEEPYVYWQPDQQEMVTVHPGNSTLIQDHLIEGTVTFDEGDMLVDDGTHPEWNDDLTKLLIQTRTGMAKEFGEPKCSKCKLWKRIATKMNNIRGKDSALIGPDCDRKWRNLGQTFKTIRERMERTGRSSVTWKFYSMMAEAMKDRSTEEDGTIDNAALQLDWTGTGSMVETCTEGESIEGESAQLVWTDDLIKLLIEIRSSMTKEFVEHRYSACKLWRRVAMRMNQARCSDQPVINGPDCDRKWRNLLQTFNAIRTRESCSEQAGVTWKFYLMMSEALVESPDGISDLSDRNVNRSKNSLWTPSLIRMLIETRSSMAKHFDTSKCSKSKLWRGIAMKINSLREDASLAFSGPDCDRKWRNLVQTFKTIRDRRQRTGRIGVNWKFYSLMLEALNEGESVELCTSSGKGLDRSRKGSTDDSDETPNWFKKYVEERRLIEDQRWEELKRMEMAKLEAIRDLSDSIKKHMCKCGQTES